jgi:phosphoglycolate phosphatase-like HAD superfamily hydrolase
VNKIAAVILDFDGVLAESNEIKDAAFGEFFSRYPKHVEDMQAFHLEHHERPRRFKFAYYVEHLMGGGEVSVDRMAEEFSALVADRVVHCPEVPGAGGFLREFSPLLPLYVSSVTPHEELQRIVAARGMAVYFKGVYGDPPNAKTDVVRQILASEGLQADQAVFVGDSASDWRVAQETGISFIGRDSGKPFPDPDLLPLPDMHAVAAALRPMV